MKLKIFFSFVDASPTDPHPNEGAGHALLLKGALPSSLGKKRSRQRGGRSIHRNASRPTPCSRTMRFGQWRVQRRTFDA